MVEHSWYVSLPPLQRKGETNSKLLQHRDHPAQTHSLSFSHVGLIRYLMLHNNHYLSRKTLISRLREENRRREGRGLRANRPPRKRWNEETRKEGGKKVHTFTQTHLHPHPHPQPRFMGQNAKETPIDVSRETSKTSLYVVLVHSFASLRV